MKIPKFIIEKIEKASVLNARITKIKKEIEEYFEDKGIDLEELPGGCNSDHLLQMIHCYIDYGEDPIEDIIRIYEEATENGNN